MTIVAVIFGISTLALYIALGFSLSELEDWKNRYDKLVDEYIEQCDILQKLNRKLKEQESKPTTPPDTHTYRVGMDRGILGEGDKIINGVYAIDEKEDGVTFEDKDGNIIAIIPGDYRYIIKEDD